MTNEGAAGISSKELIFAALAVRVASLLICFAVRRSWTSTFANNLTFMLFFDMLSGFVSFAPLCNEETRMFSLIILFLAYLIHAFKALEEARFSHLLWWPLAVKVAQASINVVCLSKYMMYANVDSGPNQSLELSNIECVIVPMRLV